MLAERRKKAAEATANTATTTTTATATKKAKKGGKVEGMMRTIALGQHYKTIEATVDEAGLPKVRAYFDAMGRGASGIPEGFDKEKFLPFKDLVKFVNDSVYKKIFGASFRGPVARDLILGTFDALLQLSEQDIKYKIPNGIRAETKLRKERIGHNPKTGAQIKVKSKKVLTMKPPRAVREFIANG